MINFDALRQGIHEAIAVRLNEIGHEMQTRAIQRAPVRRVFKGRRPKATSYASYAATLTKFSDVTMAKYENHSEMVRLKRGKANLYTPSLRFHGRNFVIKGARQVSMGGSEEQQPGRTYELANPFAQARLNSRGRWELAHGADRGRMSAIYEGHLGGRLRKSIEFDMATAGDLHASVYTEVPYAKYVEFGTRHAAAQPFLRPALMEQRGKLGKQMADELRRAARRTARQRVSK